MKGTTTVALAKKPIKQQQQITTKQY